MFKYFHFIIKFSLFITCFWIGMILFSFTQTFHLIDIPSSSTDTFQTSFVNYCHAPHNWVMWECRSVSLYLVYWLTPGTLQWGTKWPIWYDVVEWPICMMWSSISVVHLTPQCSFTFTCVHYLLSGWGDLSQDRHRRWWTVVTGPHLRCKYRTWAVYPIQTYYYTWTF